MKNDIILGYGELIQFAESLNQYEEQAWLTPLGQNKWTVKEVLGHLLLWDKYIHEEITSLILQNKTLGLSEDTDIEAFNREAGKWALSQTKEDIVSDLIASRKVVLEDLQKIPEEGYINVYKDTNGNPFVLKDFIIEMTRHDNHHKKQVENVL